MGRKRKSRRVQYFPEFVVSKIMNNDFLRSLVYVVYTAKVPVSAGEVSVQVSKLLGREISPGYVSVYLKRLEKWGAVRAYRDPTNGHLLWWRADSRVADMVAEELGKQEMKKLLQVME